MAQEIYSPQAPESFTGLLSKTKIVQKNIIDRTEKKLSLLEGRRGVRLYSTDDRTPPSLNNELDISSPNFIALGESYFIVKMRYTVKDNLNANAGDYRNWICTTSPAFSWFKNIRVEINGTEVTQSSKVADMQIVQHVLSLMESSSERLQYADSDLYGLQKLDPQRALVGVDLRPYQLGGKRKRGFAFATNTADADAGVAPDFTDLFAPRRAPSIEMISNEGLSNTVQENALRAAVGRFQYKLRPFLPFFNQDDSWLPPGTQVKLRFDLPQSELSRYLMVSDGGGGANDAASVGSVNIDLLQLDFVYTTYRLESHLTDRVRLPKQLYFHTWCPRVIQKSITDDSGTLELLHNADIPRRMILFFTDLRHGVPPTLGGNGASHSSNRLAMVHANLSQLRVTVNEDTLFDSPLKFQWEVSENSEGQYFYDYNKSSYLRGYNLVQDFFGQTYGTQIPITAADYCNHYFMIPINLNLDRLMDNPKSRGNLSIDYQFSDVNNAPVLRPSQPNASIKVNLLCMDKYLYTLSKDEGVKSEVV